MSLSRLLAVQSSRYLFTSILSFLSTKPTCMDVLRLAAKNLSVELIGNTIQYAFLELGYSAATSDQDLAIREFLKGRDIFISLPTGEGKSLCFAALVYVFDYLKRKLVPVDQRHPSICIVVSPLISQKVVKFSERGLYVGKEQTDGAVKSTVVSGDYLLVYMSPESLLCTSVEGNV